MRTRLHRIVCFFTTTVRPTRVPNAGCFRRIQKEWKQWHAAAWRQFKVVLWCHINRAGRLPMFTVFSCRDAIQAENEANTRYFEVRFFFSITFSHIFSLFLEGIWAQVTGVVFGRKEHLEDCFRGREIRFSPPASKKLGFWWAF